MGNPAQCCPVQSIDSGIPKAEAISAASADYGKSQRGSGLAILPAGCTNSGVRFFHAGLDNPGKLLRFRCPEFLLKTQYRCHCQTRCNFSVFHTAHSVRDSKDRRIFRHAVQRKRTVSKIQRKRCAVRYQIVFVILPYPPHMGAGRIRNSHYHTPFVSLLSLTD